MDDPFQDQSQIPETVYKRELIKENTWDWEGEGWDEEVSACAHLWTGLQQRQSQITETMDTDSTDTGGLLQQQEQWQ